MCFVCAGIEFGFLSVYCVGVIEIRENFAKSSEARFCNIFKNFETTYEENQILYQQKQNAQRKIHTIAEGVFCHSMPC